MRIESAAVQLAAAHRQTETFNVRSSLHFWIGARPGADAPEASATAAPDRDTIALSAAAKALAQAAPTAAPDECAAAEDAADPKLRLLKTLVEHLTGRKIDILDPHDLEKTATRAPNAAAAPAASSAAAFGLEYDARETRTESELTTFAASGVVRTQDGREIRFALNLRMSREFVSETSVRIRAGNAVQDPLVLNFDGTTAQLSETAFTFDLNADGAAETLRALQPGSGFLALDLNGDGAINDGRELFGPRTDEGFQELAAYDVDGNGWIDEADPIFRSLNLWTPDASGQGALLSLAEAGVGALSISPTDTPFALKDERNALLGQIRSTAVFLNEDGTAGTLQQIDLAV